MSPESRTIRCPTCRKPTTWVDNPQRPFCSERCRLIDLGAWADEDYRIAGPNAPRDEQGKIIEFPK